MSDDNVIKGDLICFGRNEAEGLVVLDLGTVSVREGERVNCDWRTELPYTPLDESGKVKRHVDFLSSNMDDISKQIQDYHKNREK